MKIVSVAGTKNTGKTTLVTLLVSELVKRGFKVGTVKHTHVKLDLEGKDTWKHREAGAEIVVGAGRDETFFIVTEDMDLETIISSVQQLHQLDFLVLEGYKPANYAKISTSSLDDPLSLAQVDVRELDEESVGKLADLVEERSFGKLANLDCGDCGYENCRQMALAMVKGDAKEDLCVMKQMADVILKVNGNRVPMNPFVNKFIENTFLGMISALKIKEHGEPQKIELTIQHDINQ
ncbi:molybdopterin-guanine dinucleotide biosynthesis protein B [Methanobacterium formicicum]|uniref:Molybdopterin-guanine dinucleotide biosynthesis protein MobB n=1 Tax=Methanobacterium formicicum (strain DSM 3637 / PP1) TaxID=1204725 RepID=K2R3F6_METFP|nr:molybdopterin-guanine dinucleotide biosynthesis protein B [Methanobacterium formicicum]EKF87083.1 molybdopterin-guanine dinucleotide biosynthesis protein MobB [Methanobacterium formicicum DSM 3637]